MPFSEAELEDLLCLSALTYRGYASAGVQGFDDDDVRGAIESGLAKYLEGRFALVWGPERYRSPVSTFDDSMMFVARRVAGAPRYVVAVRGTNPISAFDWVLGDLWVSRPVEWPYGARDGSTLSMSTALGLIMLQNMRSSESSGVAETLSAFKRRVTALTTAISDELVERAEQAIERIWALGAAARSRPRFVAGLAADEDLANWIGELANAIPKIPSAVGDAAHRQLFEDLETHVKLESQGRRGLDLATFLKGVVEDEGPVDIVVTGHSKGGALAPALALWLFETRSDWDPHGTAAVHCAAFAGPSPGNGPFAKRFATAFGDRFERVINEFDIVPRAWEPATLSQIGSLYVPSPRCPAPLARIVTSLSQDVGGLGYAHLGGRTTTLRPDLDKNAGTFIAQLIHQHLDGYLEAYRLPWRTTDFFDPITASPRQRERSRDRFVAEVVARERDLAAELGLSRSKLASSVSELSPMALFALVAKGAGGARGDAPEPVASGVADELVHRLAERHGFDAGHVREALGLLQNGTFERDLASVVAHTSRAVGRIPAAAARSVERALRDPTRVLGFAFAVTRDLLELPIEGVGLSRREFERLMRGGAAGPAREFPLFDHTFAALYEVESVDVLREWILGVTEQPSVQLGLLAYAHSQGVQLTREDIEAARQALQQGSLTPALVQAVAYFRREYKDRLPDIVNGLA